MEKRKHMKQVGVGGVAMPVCILSLSSKSQHSIDCAKSLVSRVALQFLVNFNSFIQFFHNFSINAINIKKM
jgi:hypothetical protein